MYYARIETFTHFFAVYPHTLQLRNLIYKFAFDFVEYEWKYDPQTRRNQRVVGKVWGGVTEDQSQFRYPISLLPKFLALLKYNNVRDEQIEMLAAPMYEPAKAEFTLKPHFVPYDYQEEGIAFTLELKANGIMSALLQMPTGTGKTLTLLALAARLKLRMAMVVAPAHLDKWVADFDSYLGLPKERVYVVRGSKAIQKLFLMAEQGLFDYDVILISLRTMQEFCKAYDENPELCEDLYRGTPFSIFEKSRVGFLGGDEVHESFNAVYNFHTFIHGPFHLGLSATMLHSDPFIERMQKNIYPMAMRFDKIKMAKYIQFINFGYRFENMEKDNIKTTFPRRTTYAQAAYEASIMKNRKVKANAFKMFEFAFLRYYKAHRQPGDKFAFYFARIDLINEFTALMKRKYPELSIERYVEDDDYDNVIKPDGRITTRGSAGTGVDIPGLITVISFDNVDSQQASLQLLGRLRNLKGKEMIFVQMYATNIQKHVLYKEKRDKLFADRLLSRVETLYTENL